jgi:hypothetical protein
VWDSIEGKKQVPPELSGTEFANGENMPSGYHFDLGAARDFSCSGRSFSTHHQRRFSMDVTIPDACCTPNDPCSQARSAVHHASSRKNTLLE